MPFSCRRAPVERVRASDPAMPLRIPRLAAVRVDNERLGRAPLRGLQERRHEAWRRAVDADGDYVGTRVGERDGLREWFAVTEMTLIAATEADPRRDVWKIVKKRNERLGFEQDGDRLARQQIGAA